MADNSINNTTTDARAGSVRIAGQSQIENVESTTKMREYAADIYTERATGITNQQAAPNNAAARINRDMAAGGVESAYRKQVQGITQAYRLSLDANQVNKVIRVALKQAIPTTDEPDDLILGGVDWIKDNWPIVCKEAKIEGLHFHELRATYVTRILEAGFDSFTARDAAGHSNVKTTGIYARPSIERVRKAVGSLSDTAQIQSGRNVGTSN